MISLIRTTCLLNKYLAPKNHTVFQVVVVKFFNTNNQFLYNQEKPSKVHLIPFEHVKDKQKDAFLDILRTYESANPSSRSNVEFIHAALKYMKAFGVHKDREVYKAILNILPKGKYIPSNVYQQMLNHYPAQQDVAVTLLDQMEDYSVIPDREMQNMLINIFGKGGKPLKKYGRMVYWMPKFANIDPWPLPDPLPRDPRLLSTFALQKMSSIDKQTRITEFKTKDLEDAIEDTWIISSMAPKQEDLLAVHLVDQPLFIEGPYQVWVANEIVDYFVLRGAPIKRKIVERDSDDVSVLQVRFWNKKKTLIPLTMHEQDDGVYFAMCATGTSSKDSLLSWIRFLQQKNPILKDIPIVFKLKTSSKRKSDLFVDSIEKVPIEDGVRETINTVTKMKEKR